MKYIITYIPEGCMTSYALYMGSQHGCAMLYGQRTCHDVRPGAYGFHLVTFLFRFIAGDTRNFLWLLRKIGSVGLSLCHFLAAGALSAPGYITSLKGGDVY